MRSRLRWQDLLPIGIATILVAYGAYLVFVGPVVTVVTPDAGSSSGRAPNIAGLFPFITGFLVIYGIWFGRERLVWAGGALSLLFSIAFLFSIGGSFIPVAMLLLASLAIRHFTAHGEVSSP